MRVFDRIPGIAPIRWLCLAALAMTLAGAEATRADTPPTVTCKAWAVADGRTGELLWGHNQDESLPTASTTKIMTAWLVVQLAQEDERILDEEVVFSERAAGTRGSTTGLRAGDRLPVRELLYGLLLPSGNDAAVALAEHFGPRFQTEDVTADADDPLALFVAQMNRAAQTLELGATRYANPHGLTAARHHSCAHDLAKLAWTAMQSPLFRQYVRTRQHECQVIDAEGDGRGVTWKNTNRLLGEGFLGVKTGTTTAAGACLVSLARQDEQELLIVVLGSTSSDARYADSRDLYRWSWQRRGEAE